MNYQGVFTDEETGELSFFLRPQSDDEDSELRTMADYGLKAEMQSDGRLRVKAKPRKTKPTAAKQREQQEATRTSSSE